jgi:ketosteroid isomerase-like protein
MGRPAAERDTARVMSRENVEVVRAMQEAFNQGNYATALSALAPDVEWHAPPGLTIGKQVYRGHDAVREGFARWLNAWEEYRFDPTEIRDCGDHVLVTGIQSGRGRGSGVDVSLRTFHVYTLRDGQVTRMRTFDDRARALNATGPCE